MGEAVGVERPSVARACERHQIAGRAAFAEGIVDLAADPDDYGAIPAESSTTRRGIFHSILRTVDRTRRRAVPGRSDRPSRGERPMLPPAHEKATQAL